MTDSIVRITKRRFGSYNDHIQRIKYLQSKRKMLIHKLTSISAGSYESMPMTGNSDKPLQDTILIQKISDIEKEIEYCRQEIYAVDVFLDTCEEEVSYAIRKIYLEGQSYDKVGLELNRSKAGVAYIIEEEILETYR